MAVCPMCKESLPKDGHEHRNMQGKVLVFALKDEEQTHVFFVQEPRDAKAECYILSYWEVNDLSPYGAYNHWVSVGWKNLPANAGVGRLKAAARTLFPTVRMEKEVRRRRMLEKMRGF